MSRAAEEDITEQLFASEVNFDAKALQTEKNYIDFAKKVSDVLFAGEAPYHLPSFLSEIARGIGKAGSTATDIKKIVDTVTVIYNNKIAEEKKVEGQKAKPKQKAKPQLAGGKAAESYSRNNNPAMVNDIMKNEEEYGYGEEYYAEEEATSTYKGKVAEASYDFM